MNIRNIIKSEIPNNLNELEIARYIYVKLAFLLNFSTKYNNTSEKEFSEMYVSKEGIDEIKYNQIICKKWARIYSTLLSEYGIENKIVNQGHEYVIFKYEDKFWLADATGGEYTDLAKIRYGEKTNMFGICGSQDINKPKNFINNDELIEKQIEEIDKKINFYQLKKQNNKKIKEELSKLSNSNISIAEKIEYMIKIIGICCTHTRIRLHLVLLLLH